MLLALIGYRGSGKSVVARLVALRLGWDWIDADAEIELRAGKSIAKIFADDGEPAFRQLEIAVLAELSPRIRTVLALGGGAILREENRHHLKRGRVVWLKACPEVLHQRILADATTAARRPKLTAGGGLSEIKQLLAQREALYQMCADLTIDTDGKSPMAVAEQIVEWIKGVG